MLDERLQSLDGKLYATIYWFENMRDGICRASNQTLGKVIKSSSSGVANSLVRLRDCGYIVSHYDEFNHRTGINTLLRMQKTPYSAKEGGVTPRSNILEKTKEEYTSETLKDIELVHRAWLVHWIIGPDRDPDATVEERALLLEQAAKKYRLTPKRKKAIAVRLGDAGRPMIVRAIKNLAASPFHRGENDSGWTADLVEFLLRNYEMVETWANKGGEE